MQISELIALSAHAEKLGIIGVLFLICCILFYAARHFRAELIKKLAEMDRLKTAFIIVKNAADASGVKYDLRQAREIDDLIEEKG